MRPSAWAWAGRPVDLTLWSFDAAQLDVARDATDDEALAELGGAVAVSPSAALAARKRATETTHNPSEQCRPSQVVYVRNNFRVRNIRALACSVFDVGVARDLEYNTCQGGD